MKVCVCTKHRPKNLLHTVVELELDINLWPFFGLVLGFFFREESSLR